MDGTSLFRNLAGSRSEAARPFLFWFIHLSVFISVAACGGSGGGSVVPVNAAVGVAFTDIDRNLGQIEGDSSFTPAAVENDVTEYRLYWGQDADTRFAGNDTVIDTVLVNGGTAFAAFPADTTLPAGASHLLVFTANANGELATGVSVPIVDLVLPFAYVANNGANTVSVIDTSTNTVPVGTGPVGIAITP